MTNVLLRARRRATALVIGVAAVLSGCALTVRSPANNQFVPLPSADVLVTANGAISGLRVTIDGNDVSSGMTLTTPQRATGTFALGIGSHTVRASGQVACWYCPGGTTTSTSSSSFVVVSGNAQLCARSASVPVISIDPALASVGQQPGRQLIGYQLQNGEAIMIIVDDAPGLLRTQMLVEVDLDVAAGVTRSKMVEAWSFCQNARAGFVTAGMRATSFGEGLICNGLSAANDFRSGCTTFDPPMLIDQATTRELWLRKQGVFGNWDDKEAIDPSIWPVFGGRRLRFVWIRD